MVYSFNYSSKLIKLIPSEFLFELQFLFYFLLNNKLRLKRGAVVIYTLKYTEDIFPCSLFFFCLVF